MNDKLSLLTIGAGLLAAVSFISGQLLAPNGSAESVPPLTYETPLKVLTKRVRIGDPFTTQSTRCNNTDHDIAVEITIWWLRSDGHLIPFKAMQGGQIAGPRFDVTIPPGCRENYQSTSVFPGPGVDGISPGLYDLRGQACYGGISLDEPSVCTGWRTEQFEVLP